MIQVVLYVKDNTDNNMDNKNERNIAFWKMAASHIVLNEIVAEIHKKTTKNDWSMKLGLNSSGKVLSVAPVP